MTFDGTIQRPPSETIRNAAQQLLALARDGDLTPLQVGLAAGTLIECAEDVELLEGLAGPTVPDTRSGKVLLFDEIKCLAAGGAITAPPRRRGFWRRFQNILRRV